VGLEPRADHRPSQLSGGEQQRVAVARAIVHRPRLVLADEPTANLDTTTSSELMQLLREINQTLGTTIVLVTHNEHLAQKHCDRILRMRDGRLLNGAGPEQQEGGR
jgi:putative ABC transport system ATP-binding protein